MNLDPSVSSTDTLPICFSMIVKQAILLM